MNFTNLAGGEQNCLQRKRLCRNRSKTSPLLFLISTLSCERLFKGVIEYKTVNVNIGHQKRACIIAFII